MSLKPLCQSTKAVYSAATIQATGAGEWQSPTKSACRYEPMCYQARAKAKDIEQAFHSFP
jgi:hypothetical protein